jgi:putative endonuclease
MGQTGKWYYIYILVSKRNGTLYTGVTNDIKRRVQEHRLGVNDGFTNRHQVHRLVYVEQYASPTEAITREKQIKAGSRKAKLRLIEGMNPDWSDLAEGL